MFLDVLANEMLFEHQSLRNNSIGAKLPLTFETNACDDSPQPRYRIRSPPHACSRFRNRRISPAGTIAAETDGP